MGSPVASSLTNPLTDWLNNRLFEIIKMTNPDENIHCLKFFVKQGCIILCTIICDTFSIY